MEGGMKGRELEYVLPEDCKLERISKLSIDARKLCSKEIDVLKELNGNENKSFCEISLDNKTCNRWSLPDWLFTLKPGVFGHISGCANITGVIMTIVLTIIVIFSLPPVRKGGHFQVNCQIYS